MSHCKKHSYVNLTIKFDRNKNWPHGARRRRWQVFVYSVICYRYVDVRVVFDHVVWVPVFYIYEEEFGCSAWSLVRSESK